ncbi:hypothetical protein P8452_15444 [Trifolium repens]|nr:hypothetical protein P8452_15444 [Trifolium repens]
MDILETWSVQRGFLLTSCLLRALDLSSFYLLTVDKPHRMALRLFKVTNGKKKKSLFLQPSLNLLHTNPTIWSRVVCFLARREEGVLAKWRNQRGRDKRYLAILGKL